MAAPAAASWATTRVYGTWVGHNGAMLVGTYKVYIPARIGNTPSDVTVPAGLFASGSLAITPGSPSFDMEIPCNNDPDNFPPGGWQPAIVITFSQSGIEPETYVIDTFIGVEVNLRTVVLAETIPDAVNVLIRGVAGGLAELDADGDVINASGAKVTGGGLDEEALAAALVTPLAAKAPVASPTFTGTVAGVTKSHVGLGNVDNTSDANKPVSTAAQTAIDLKAPLASPTFTGTVSGVTKTHVGLANVDNTSDANKPVSTATTTQLNLKAPLASPTFTGTVSGVTKTHVGLSLVDNVQQVPASSARIRIAATALNTWPARTASLPSGFTGKADWDHSDYGAVTTLPVDIVTGDWVSDLAP